MYPTTQLAQAEISYRQELLAKSYRRSTKHSEPLHRRFFHLRARHTA
ncbi:hypothetical protein [Kribbella deserti]|uniref:Uncharacterized protein n=1 Tax=Kribbella deserti TaxID=1926257 RepID=A0ABV6QVH0_9ACTN